jgi:hypothetical protein
MVHNMLAQAAGRCEIRQDVDLEATARLIHALTIAAGDSQFLAYLNTYFQVVGEDVPPERMSEPWSPWSYVALGQRIQARVEGVGVGGRSMLRPYGRG